MSTFLSLAGFEVGGEGIVVIPEGGIEPNWVFRETSVPVILISVYGMIVLFAHPEPTDKAGVGRLAVHLG